MSSIENESSRWPGIYRLGGLAAWAAVLVGVAEILITFLPGGNTPHGEVLDWFGLFQENAFMGLRDLGLLNILLDACAVPIFLALYLAHRSTRARGLAALGALAAFLGVGVFLSTNRAFAMLALSQQYAAATSDAQRAVLEAAGQAMLSVGQSHTAGTFLAFFLTEIAGVIISGAMLRGRVFPAAAGYVGMLGFGCLMVFETLAAFVSGLSTAVMLLAMVGGLLSLAWYILIARGLSRLERAG